MIHGLLLAALAICPVHGTIDRIEDGTLVVLGEYGVRLIARSEVQSSRPHGPREGDRIEESAGCRARAPRRVETRAMFDRISEVERSPSARR